MPEPNASFNADINLTGWDRSVNEMKRDADDIDAFMNSIVDSIGDVERAANSVDVDIKPKVDDSELKQADNTINDVRADLDRLDSETASPNIEPTGETETRNQLEDIKGKLDEIALYERFTFVWNFLTNLDQIVETIEQIPGLGGLIELDRAGAAFAAQTGQDVDAVDALITALYTGEDAIIATRDEIAQMAAVTYQATRNFGTLEQDVIAVNNVAETFGQDFNEVLATANQLVQTGLAANMTEATDLIAAGFQSGANRGGDLLDVLNEYASTFAEAGYTGGQALGAINAGLDAGSGNADRVADAIRELGIRTTTAGDSINGFDQAFEDAATAAGVLDEAIAFRAGTLSGADYLAAVSAGVATIADEGERAAAAAGLFATQAEDLGTGFVTNVGTGDDFDNIEGRAQEAADTIHDTLSRTLQEFSQEIDQAFVDILDAANVDEWINEARGKLQTFLSELRGGRSIGEALEIALEIPGLSDTLQQIQVVLQDVGIGLLQGVQALLQFTGRGDLAAGLAPTIESLGTGQLGFAASVAQEADDIAAAVNSAASRGLDRLEIGRTIEEQLQTAIENGNLEAAQAILESAEGGALFPLETSISAYEAQIATLAADIQTQFDNAIRSGDFAGAGLLADELGTDLRTELVRAVEEQDFNLAAILATQLGGAEGVELQSVVASALAAGLSEEQITEMLNNAQGVVDGTATMSDEVIVAGDNITTTLQDAGVSFEDFETIVTARSQAADLAFSSFADNVGYKAAETAGALLKLEESWTRLTLAMGGNAPPLPGGGGGSSGNTTNNNTNTTININQTNNGGAAAAAGGNQVSNWVRGQ